MRMSKLFVIVGKLGAMAGIAAIAYFYCAWRLAFAQHRPWAAHYVPLNTSVAIVTGALACAVILLLNERNVDRVIVVSLLSVVCALIGVVFLSDPHMHGSYDHGFGETEQNALILGSLGAIVGYGIACALLAAWHNRKNGPEATG